MAKSISVLVVDDESDFLESLVTRLQLRGFKAIGAESGPSALGVLAMEKVDVVVLDLKMPGMDGMAVLESIKARHPQVEVLMLTGHASTEAGQDRLREKAFACLIKPTPIEELIRGIEAAFAHKLESGGDL